MAAFLKKAIVVHIQMRKHKTNKTSQLCEAHYCVPTFVCIGFLYTAPFYIVEALYFLLG